MAKEIPEALPTFWNQLSGWTVGCHSMQWEIFFFLSFIVPPPNFFPFVMLSNFTKFHEDTVIFRGSSMDSMFYIICENACI